MIYFAPYSPKLDTPTSRQWGYLLSPRRGQLPANDGRAWGIDNDAFTGFNADAFFSFLRRIRHKNLDGLKFVNCPDVVGNCLQTQQLYKRYAGEIHLLGFPVGFVAQDGQENYPLPKDYDALFIGGSTQWKLSKAADRLIAQAQAAGKWVHVGRVNSQRRMRHFMYVGVDSVDGTKLIYEPDNARRIFNNQLIQPSLFGRVPEGSRTAAESVRKGDTNEHDN